MDPQVSKVIGAIKDAFETQDVRNLRFEHRGNLLVGFVEVGESEKFSNLSNLHRQRVFAESMRKKFSNDELLEIGPIVLRPKVSVNSRRQQ